MAAQAAVQEVRVVGVGIDNSSGEAEALARDYVRKRAVYLAARRLGAADPAAQVARFPEDQWNEVVRGITISQSRRDGYKTYVDAQVTIVTEALQRALKLPVDAAVAATTEYDTRGVLLLSVYAAKERAYLWESENVLRAPLTDEVLRQARGTVLLPGGDLEDLRLIDYQNALTVTPDELKPMFERYGAEEIIIAVLTMGQPGTSDPSSVLMRRLRPDGVRNETLDIPLSSPEETSKDRLQHAARAVAGAVTQIATSTAERDARARENAKQIKLYFNYRTPKDLAQLQQMVREAPEVLYLDVPSINLARVLGTLYLKGDEAALRERLTRAGVVVTTVSDGWRVSMH